MGYQHQTIKLCRFSNTSPSIGPLLWKKFYNKLYLIYDRIKMKLIVWLKNNYKIEFGILDYIL